MAPRNARSGLHSLLGTLLGVTRMDSIPELPAHVDHIVLATPNLERGMDEIERAVGVRPIAGGRHPAYGTHNAVLSLGPSTYVEVIAQDPDLPRPTRGVLFGLDEIAESRLTTWVLRTECIDETTATARTGGVELGVIQPGRRETPDGTVLSWRLTDPYNMQFDGCVPFLVSWGETPHPAAGAPSGGELVGLRLEHPHPAELREALAALGVDMKVCGAKVARLIATVRTPGGNVELR